jgi:alpha-tubulin suppressor-like RCC1 family protein
LFCFGDNQFGQLGTGDNKSTNVPIELKFFKNENLKEIICQSDFSFALCGISILFNCKKTKYSVGERMNLETLHMEILKIETFQHKLISLMERK